MIRIGLHGGGEMRVHTDGRADAVDVADVTPECLAFGLAHVTRFGGQAGPYSVGEHEVRMWDWAKAEGQDKAVLRGIMIHDAPETLGEGDHQRFVKRAFFGDGPAKYSALVCAALWDKFAPSMRAPAIWPWVMIHDALKPYDEYMGSLEARAFGFPHDPIPEWIDGLYAPGSDPWDRWDASDTINAWLERWEDCE